MAHKPFVGTHVPDAEWLIALWLAIHGGDPSPVEKVVDEAAAREAALAIIAAVMPYVSPSSTQGASVAVLAKLSVAVMEPDTATPAGTAIKAQRCYSTGNGHYCINNPPPGSEPPQPPPRIN